MGGKLLSRTAQDTVLRADIVNVKRQLIGTAKLGFQAKYVRGTFVRSFGDTLFTARASAPRRAVSLRIAKNVRQPYACNLCLVEINIRRIAINNGYFGGRENVRKKSTIQYT